jgi:hypothetical protein
MGNAFLFIKSVKETSCRPRRNGWWLNELLGIFCAEVTYYPMIVRFQCQKAPDYNKTKILEQYFFDIYLRLRWHNKLSILRSDEETIKECKAARHIFT